MNTETERPLDEEIASFFSNDEASDDMSHSFTHTSPQKQNDPQGKFPFHVVIYWYDDLCHVWIYLIEFKAMHDEEECRMYRNQIC